MAFPVALALGLVSDEAGDSVNSVSADLATGQLPQTSTITDSSGNPIAHLFDQNREAVPADRIAPAMKAAIVAIEDRRFYQHQGVDWQGTIRALVANSTSGDVVQGASTLTQQYVKNYLLYVEARTETERLKATPAASRHPGVAPPRCPDVSPNPQRRVISPTDTGARRRTQAVARVTRAVRRPIGRPIRGSGAVSTVAAGRGLFNVGVLTA